jgi:hypothetical protein
MAKKKPATTPAKSKAAKQAPAKRSKPVPDKRTPIMRTPGRLQLERDLEHVDRLLDQRIEQARESSKGREALVLPDYLEYRLPADLIQRIRQIKDDPRDPAAGVIKYTVEVKFEIEQALWVYDELIEQGAPLGLVDQLAGTCNRVGRWMVRNNVAYMNKEGAVKRGRGGKSTAMFSDEDWEIIVNKVLKIWEDSQRLAKEKRLTKEAACCTVQKMLAEDETLIGRKVPEGVLPEPDTIQKKAWPRKKGPRKTTRKS